MSKVAPKPRTQPAHRNPAEEAVIISGSNIGMGESEPEVTDAMRDMIASRLAMRLPIVQTKDTRRAVPDPEQAMVRVEANNTISASPSIWLTNISPTAYKIGHGPWNYEPSYGQKMYMDLVMVDINGKWMFPQWTTAMFVLEGVPRSVYMRRPKRQTGKEARTIGIHFARGGLYKPAFGPIIETIEAIPSFKGIKSRSRVVETELFYWTNTSWGVSNSPGKFSYKTTDSSGRPKVVETTELKTAMEILNTRSALSPAVLAISISAPAAQNSSGTWVPIRDQSTFSFKLHSFQLHKIVDWHGPAQQNAASMVITTEMMEDAETVYMPAAQPQVTDFTDSLFSTGFSAPPPYGAPGPGIDMELTSMMNTTNLM